MLFWLSLVQFGMKAILLRLMLNCTASFRLSIFASIFYLPTSPACTPSSSSIHDLGSSILTNWQSNVICRRATSSPQRAHKSFTKCKAPCQWQVRPLLDVHGCKGRGESSPGHCRTWGSFKEASTASGVFPFEKPHLSYTQAVQIPVGGLARCADQSADQGTHLKHCHECQKL